MIIVKNLLTFKNNPLYLANHIQISEDANMKLISLGSFQTKYRGEFDIKVKSNSECI